MNDVEAYIEQLPESQKVHLERIRTIVHALVPDVEETISYGMPTFKYIKKPLLHVAAFASHMSVFPTGDDALVGLPEVNKFRTGKGTLQFTENDPIPDAVIELIVMTRVHSIDSVSS